VKRHGATAFSVLNASRPFASYRTLSRDGRAMDRR
jgi:hypothetical protein